jgi:hypothetical protein
MVKEAKTTIDDASTEAKPVTKNKRLSYRNMTNGLMSLNGHMISPNQVFTFDEVKRGETDETLEARIKNALSFGFLKEV